MKRKEAIIRYLAHVSRANRNQIAEAIRSDPQVVSSRLVELRRTGIVRYMKWSDGSKARVLTPDGYRRHDNYQLRDKKQEVQAATETE